MCLQAYPRLKSLEMIEKFILLKNKSTSILLSKCPQWTRNFEESLKCGRQNVELIGEITEQSTKMKNATKCENSSGCF